MKHIFIIGARGYHANYGGWETFVSNLVDNYNDDNTLFHISEVTDVKDKKCYKINNNITVDPIYVNFTGGFKMLFCTIKAFKYYLNLIVKNNIENAYLYVLGLKLGPLLKLYKSKIKKLNIKVLINPDGLEHERSKWNALIKRFFLLSENWMLNNCDVIVCDAKGIKKYIDTKYPNLRKKTIFIAYGTNSINFKNIDEMKILKKYNLKIKEYILMCGRFVPENNFELIINEYMKSNIEKQLIIVSNISFSNYHKEVLEKTNCSLDERIVFIDGVYNQEELATLRKNAFAYIHGHSVGGTNPSLLEALSLTDLNILYDVNFNKDVGQDSCIYFDEKKSLSKILNSINEYDQKALGRECRRIISENYTWKIIVNKYKNLFR